MSFHVAVKETMVRRFDHEGLRQLQNCFVTDEDLRGRNVLSLSLYCYEGLRQLQNCFVTDEDLHGRNVLPCLFTATKVFVSYQTVL